MQFDETNIAETERGPDVVEQSSLARPEIETTHIGDLFSTDILPWYKISKYFPSFVNIGARMVANGLQKCFYVLYATGLLFAVLLNLPLLKKAYAHSYWKSNCSEYYAFDFENFTHYTISSETKNGSNNTVLCDNSPMYFLVEVFSQMQRILICVGWLYSVDRRYGVLKLRYENFTLRCREMTLFVQVPLILIMFPVNLLVATAFTYTVIPFVVIFAIFNWVCRCTCIDRCMGRFLKDSEIFFLYILLTLQSFIDNIIWCIELIVRATQIRLEDSMFLNISYYEFILLTMFIIRMLHMIRNGKHFHIFFTVLKRILPLFLSLWTYGDVILDIVQTNKYNNLIFVENEHLNILLSITAGVLTI